MVGERGVYKDQGEGMYNGRGAGGVCTMVGERDVYNGRGAGRVYTMVGERGVYNGRGEGYGDIVRSLLIKIYTRLTFNFIVTCIMF